MAIRPPEKNAPPGTLLPLGGHGGVCAIGTAPFDCGDDAAPIRPSDYGSPFRERLVWVTR